MKKVEYPHCTLKDAFEITQIVDNAGGNTKIGVVADQTGMSEKGGGFLMKIHGTVKYGLLKKNGNDLEVTSLGDRILHPTNEYEKEMAILDAVKHVPIFDKILKKFQGKEIQRDYLPNILIREFDINKKFATRVVYYFFKANDIANFLRPVKKGIFLVKEEEEANDLEIDDRAENDIDEINGGLKMIRSFGMDEGTFNLVYSLGLMKSDFQIALDSIKSTLENDRKSFSHFGLLFDFMFSQFKDKTITEDQFKTSLPKLIEAVKKDLRLEKKEEDS